MLPLEDALAQMLNQLPFPTKTGTLALTEAANRVSAEDVISPINVPFLIVPRWMAVRFV